MDPIQLIVNIALGIASLLGGFVLSAVWSAVKDLQTADKQLCDKVSSIETLVAGNYMRREESIAMHTATTSRFEKVLETISSKLDIISDRLSSKMDKSDCAQLHAHYKRGEEE